DTLFLAKPFFVKIVGNGAGPSEFDCAMFQCYSMLHVFPTLESRLYATLALLQIFHYLSEFGREGGTLQSFERVTCRFMPGKNSPQGREMFGFTKAAQTIGIGIDVFRDEPVGA